MKAIDNIKDWYKSIKHTQYGRSSAKNTIWKNKVKRRDSYRCKLCNHKNHLEVHHIIPWSSSIRNRFKVSNGMTLCRQCHKHIHLYFEFGDDLK